jgi:hypothetical protein
VARSSPGGLDLRRLIVVCGGQIQHAAAHRFIGELRGQTADKSRPAAQRLDIHF